MTESNFFLKMANDVLETADHVAARLEESLTLVFGGDKKGSRDAGDPSAANDFTMEDYDQDDGDDGDFENPLKGMADGVLGGILEGQVRGIRLAVPARVGVGALLLHVFVCVFSFCSGQSIDTARTLSRLSIRHYVVRTLYSVARSLSNCHVLRRHLRVASGSRLGIALDHDGDDCRPRQVVRVSKSYCGSALAKLLYTKLL
jgi:hypothetical protein